MADAAAPAPELKEYPEFPGQKLSKRYVCCVSCFRCHHHHHHHHHHHPRFGFLHIRSEEYSPSYSLSHKNKHKTVASTKKCSRDKKRTKKKPQKLPPRCDYSEAREEFSNSKMRALKPFFVFFSFFKKLSSFSSLRPMIKTSNLFFFCFALYGCRKCCCCWKEEVLT